MEWSNLEDLSTGLSSYFTTHSSDCWEGHNPWGTPLPAAVLFVMVEAFSPSQKYPLTAIKNNLKAFTRPRYPVDALNNVVRPPQLQELQESFPSQICCLRGRWNSLAQRILPFRPLSECIRVQDECLILSQLQEGQDVYAGRQSRNSQRS